MSMESCAKYHQLLVVFIKATMTMMIIPTSDAIVTGHFYTIVGDPSIGLYGPIVTWPGVSLLQCSLRCSQASQCVGLALDYSPGGTSCWLGRRSAKRDDSTVATPAGEPLPAGLLLTRANGQLLSKCRLDLGFELRTDGDRCRCLYVSSEKASYLKAKQSCNSKSGSRLAKANTVNFLSLLGDIGKERRFSIRLYIGLDDRKTEMAFVWSDGSLLTDEERQTLFFPGEPNNLRGEDCVLAISRADATRINDAPCGNTLRYVCEIDHF